jgi:DNA-binding transcriptional LysR family regulator
MLGRRIDALEKRLGTKLMHRTTRHLTLTEQGNVFLEHCRKLLGDIEVAEKSIARRPSQGDRPSCRLRAGGIRTLHVAPHAPAFLANHPEVQMSFNLTDRVVDLVREGYDLGIRIGGAIEPSFVAVKLASNRRVVCGAGILAPQRHSQDAGRPGAAQLPGLQPAGRPAARLVFPAGGQAGDRSACMAIWIATTANCCTAGPAKDSGWVAFDLGDPVQLASGS